MSDWEFMRRQMAIAGLVTDAETGTAVPDACVQITAAPDSFATRVYLQAKLAGSRPVDRTTTRADGSFYFLDLPDGLYTVTTWMPGRAPLYDPFDGESSVSRDANGRIQTTWLHIALTPYTGTAVLPPVTLAVPERPTSTAAPQPAFAPTDLAGCRLWLDAGTLTAVANGQVVAAWPDASGHQHDATQTEVADQPIYQAHAFNGQPALQFNGENHFLRLPLTETVTDHTFFFVYDNTPGGGHSHYLFDAQSGRLALNAADTSSVANVRFSDGTWRTLDLATVGPQVLTWRFAGDTAELFRHGVMVGAAVYTPRPLTGQLAVAANYQGRSSFFAGLIAEIVYYNRALPPAERQAVENYLHGRYII